MRWQSARILAEGDQASEATMQGVDGEVYRAERATARFRGNSGEADKRANVLRLNGQVRVNGIESGVQLDCDALTYDAGAKVLKARGRVTISGANGEAGPFDEVWATPDLKEVSTPELFGKKP